jgi:hypothetical protein
MSDLLDAHRKARELHLMACTVEDAAKLALSADDEPTRAMHVMAARKAAKALDAQLKLTLAQLPPPLLIVDGPMASQHPTARDFPEPPNAA